MAESTLLSVKSGFSLIISKYVYIQELDLAMAYPTQPRAPDFPVLFDHFCPIHKKLF